MCGWGKGRCAKCVDPPTCDCFVSSTDGQEIAAPSAQEVAGSSGQEVAAPSGQEVAAPSGQEVAGPSGQAAAPPPRQADVESQEGQDSPWEGSVHTSPHEEVQWEEDEGEEDDHFMIGREIMLGQDRTFESSPEATPEAGTSQATIRGGPSHSSPNMQQTPWVTLSPPPRPQASGASRRSTQETRGGFERLPVSLRRDNARQTRSLGEMKKTLNKMEHSLDVMRESLGDVATNSVGVITCLWDLKNATTGVGQEVTALTQAVKDNTRAVEDNTRAGQANTAAITGCLTRIAVALEGRPAGGQTPGEAPSSPAHPPPHEDPPSPAHTSPHEDTPSPANTPPVKIIQLAMAVAVAVAVPVPVGSPEGALGNVIKLQGYFCFCFYDFVYYTVLMIWFMCVNDV